MRFVITFLLITFVTIEAQNGTEISPYIRQRSSYFNEDIKFIQRMGAFIQKLDVDDKWPEILVNSMEQIAVPAIGAVATIATLASFILAAVTAVQLEQIKGQLSSQMAYLEQSFTLLDRRVEILTQTVQNSAIRIHFKEQQSHIFNLQKMLERHIGAKNEHTTKDLIRECESNNMIKFVGFISRETKTEGELTIKQLMVGNSDMKYFGDWSKVLAKSVMTSVMLHGYCLGIRISDTNERNAVSKKDTDFFRGVWNNLQNFITKGRKHIISNHMRTAGKEVEEYAASHQNEKHEDFNKKVYEILSKKYFFRKWLILSYDDHTGGNHHHVIGGKFVHFWFRKYSRCVYIASTNNDKYIQSKLDSCIQRHKKDNWYNSAKLIFDGVRGCLGSVNGLAVVLGERNPKVLFSAGGYSWIKTKYSIDLGFMNFGVSERSFLLVVVQPEV